MSPSFIPPATSCYMSSVIAGICLSINEQASAPSLLRDRDAPRQLAHLDALDHLEAGHVDHRHVIGHAVGDEQELLPGRERHLPHTLAHQEILLHFVGGGIDDGYTVGWSERHEGGL